MRRFGKGPIRDPATPALPGQRAILVLRGDTQETFWKLLRVRLSISCAFLTPHSFCCPSSSTKSSELLSAHLIWTRLDTADICASACLPFVYCFQNTRGW